MAPAADSQLDRILAFDMKVRRTVSPPLLPPTPKSRRAVANTLEQPALPKRSERLANHPLANIASSKRAEVVLMCRFNVLPEELPANESKTAYNQLYKEKLNGDCFEGLGAIAGTTLCKPVTWPFGLSCRPWLTSTPWITSLLYPGTSVGLILELDAMLCAF